LLTFSKVGVRKYTLHWRQHENCHTRPIAASSEVLNLFVLFCLMKRCSSVHLIMVIIVMAFVMIMMTVMTKFLCTF